MPALQANAELKETRRRLDQLISDEKDAGVEPQVALAKLVKEIAFTHLNRLVALKMLEHPSRRVVRRAAVAGYPEPNGFRMYLPDHQDDYKLYEQGTAPVDELSESPRDRAYRHFLLWQYCELAKEVRVLFDPDNLASRLFPRPKALRQIIERLNGEALNEAWKPGNEETIGWVYQFFIAEEKAAAFKKVFKDKKKFLKEDIPAATQVFTPRWIVKFLVQNGLGRLWLSMHPDSSLAATWEYLVPPAGNLPASARKSVKEIRLLDPATGTMHFGLVAFDLLVSMYREEMANAGKDGWPKEASVERDEDIPASILANNLFGVDIDLRAVQLSALALYVRAKGHHRDVALTESNLACADVTIFRGQHRKKITNEMVLPRGLSRQLFDEFCDALDEASMMGSLVRLEHLFQEKLWAGDLKTAIDAYVRKRAAEGEDESYFGNETAKGLRLLDLLMHRYDVVFTNPPYMSSRNMSPQMLAFMKRNYKNSKGDLYSAFIERCAELLGDGGRVAMITQQSFMFISSYEDLRKVLLSKAAVESMAHVGSRSFDEVQGAKVNTTAFVLRKEASTHNRSDSIGIYFRLVEEPDANAKRLAFEQALAHRIGETPDTRIYEYRQGDFAAIGGSPWVYWITPTIRNLFIRLTPLGDVAATRHGLATLDNTRFVRYWWEVGISAVARNCPDREAARATGMTWFPYMKGGPRRRWWGNQEYVVNWRDDGAEMRPFIESKGQPVAAENWYFRAGITYSYLTGGSFSARLTPQGFIFDVAGSSIFCNNTMEILALLNSRFVHYALALINPTVNHQSGDLARVPVPKAMYGQLGSLAERGVTIAKGESQEDETTYDFIAPPQWPDSGACIARRARLTELDQQIDEAVYRSYEISQDDLRAMDQDALDAGESDDSDESLETPDAERLPLEDTLGDSREELARSWVSYAVGIALGHFSPGSGDAFGRGTFGAKVATKLRELRDSDGIMVLEEGHPDDLARRVFDVLHLIHSEKEAEEILCTATARNGPARDNLEEYLLGGFFKSHVKRYRKHPIYWLIQSPKKSYGIYLLNEKTTPDTLSLLRGNRYLGGRLNRLQQDQTSLSKAVLKGDKGARKKAGEIAELLEELQEFDRRLEAATRVPAKDKDGRNVTVRWEPELDDGVYINAAPLHELLPSWRDVNPKKAWQELAAGDYDWSKTAMRYWPQRVITKCKDNKSYAIAHGLA
jgi:hypothetical protein